MEGDGDIFFEFFLEFVLFIFLNDVSVLELKLFFLLSLFKCLYISFCCRLGLERYDLLLFDMSYVNFLLLLFLFSRLERRFLFFNLLFKMVIIFLILVLFVMIVG